MNWLDALDLSGTALASGGLAIACGLFGAVVGYLIGLREKGRG